MDLRGFAEQIITLKTIAFASVALLMPFSFPADHKADCFFTANLFGNSC